MHAARTMSYLAPASFRFVWGIIRKHKVLIFANLVSLEGIALRFVASKIYHYKSCYSKCRMKNPVSTVLYDSYSVREKYENSGIV